MTFSDSLPPLPSKKRGRTRKYQTHGKPTKKSKKPVTKLEKLNKFIEKTEKEVQTEKERKKLREIEAKAKAAAYLANKKQSGILPQETLDVVPEVVKDTIKKDIVFEPFPKQIEYLQAGEDHVLMGGGRGPLMFGEKVLTPHGWRNIEKLKIGSPVRCPDNSISYVIDIPWEGEDDCYEFTFIDGRKIVSGASHTWQIEISNRSLKKGSRREVLRTTQQIVDHFEKHVRGKSGNKKDIRNISIPIASALDLDVQPSSRLSIDPYLLGLLLGDGCLQPKAISITSADEEIHQSIVDLYKEGISRAGINARFRKPKKLLSELKKLGLEYKKSSEKFIPIKYKNASLVDRISILQGLMDTDGTVDKGGHLSYCSTSKRLAEDVQYLIRSLGGKATLTTKEPFYTTEEGIKVFGKTAYTLYIHIEDSHLLFRLTRKKARCRKIHSAANYDIRLRLVDVKYVGRKKARCITIDDPRGLFVATDFIVTHNSGKSACFIFEPLQWVGNKNFHGLFIRRNLVDLRDLIRRCQDMYQRLIPSVQWKVKENVFVFPSGATIEFGHLDSEQDVEKYRGQEFTFIGLDEISQIPDYTWVSRLLGSLRSSDPDLRVYFRATTNWTGIGIDWVKEYWHIDTVEQGKTVVEKSAMLLPDGSTKEVVLTKKWFNSTIFDNPKMANDTQYLAFLNSQPEYLKRAWLYGETTSVEGVAFPDFVKQKHVIEPFEIPSGWKKYTGCDYGRGDGAANVWIAIDPATQDVYCYREYVANMKQHKVKLSASEFAAACLETEGNSEYVQWRIIDGSLYDKRGSSEPSLYDEMRKVGFIARPADKSKGSRVAGKNKIHELLRIENDKPKFFVFNNCPTLVKMFMTIPVDANNAEDVNTDFYLDHIYDALRYVLMSRPSHRPKLIGSNMPIIYNWRK